MENNRELSQQLEKIEQYANGVKIEFGSVYQIRGGELTALLNLIAKDPFAGMCLSFDFGRAKGYRMAKNQEKKRRARA